MPNLIRSFIAIELNKETRSALSNLQAELRTAQADVKWVEYHNIHLSLRFLGNLAGEDIEKIKKIIDETSRIIKIFKLSIGGVGAFPKSDYPRVIWVGIEKGQDELKKVSEILETKLKIEGIPKADHPFSAHITIGRVRSSLRRRELAIYLKNVKWRGNLELLVDKLNLFESTLTPKGSIYSLLYQASLQSK